ncbi:MAG: hypothetical protein DAHOPDDO_00065 [Ignavibacteriaceae bacterium]|nr:hypothetical protein [Ignavibacteriaceae bacterium]
MIHYKGGNGSSKQESIVILGAANESEGIDAEYKWLEVKFDKQNIDWELSFQELVDEGNKQYDILTIKLTTSEMKETWFDITDFYGKEDDE